MCDGCIPQDAQNDGTSMASERTNDLYLLEPDNA